MRNELKFFTISLIEDIFGGEVLSFIKITFKAFFSIPAYYSSSLILTLFFKYFSSFNNEVLYMFKP